MKAKTEIKRVGKHQRYPKNTKKFAVGGATDDDEYSLDNLSFGQAFNAVRNMVPDAKTFMWRGKKYSTAMAATKKATPTSSKDMDEVQVTARSPAVQKRDAYDPLAHYGREDINWEDVSPALTPSKAPVKDSVMPKTSYSRSPNYDLFRKITQGATPPPGYYSRSGGGMRKGGKVKRKSC